MNRHVYPRIGHFNPKFWQSGLSVKNLFMLNFKIVKMKKFLILTFIAALVTVSSNALVATGNKDVAGEWKYEVPTAPYGYEKGVLNFSEKENELAGEVKFNDGYKISLKDVSYKGDTVKFGLYIDYQYIGVTATVEEGKMTGFVDSPEGKMKLTAEKSR